MARILVLCVGNTLLSDDGAGVHAALSIRERAGHVPGLAVLDGGTLGIPLLPALAGADALITVDASRDGLAPGEVRVHEGDEFDRYVAHPERSAHGKPLAQLVEAARHAGRLPQRRVLISIEPARVDWGLEATPTVKAALPRCVDAALAFVHRWGGDGAARDAH